MQSSIKTGLICFATLAVLMMSRSVCPAASADNSAQHDLLLMRYDRVNRLLRAGSLDEAMREAQKALAAARRIYGPNAAATAPAIDRVAAVFRAMGHFRDAEQYMLRALELVRRELGDRHPHSIAAMNNLAGLYKEMGRYGEAEKLYRQAIEGQRALQDNRPGDEIGLLSNLAVLHMINTRYAEAEPLLIRALQLAEKSAERDWLTERMKLSTDRQQLEVARRMQNLANLYFKMKRYQDSEALTLKALDVCRRIVGDAHPEVARIKSDLGVLYFSTGAYVKAEAMMSDAIKIARQVYGDKPQPVVADYYTSLAQLYDRTGNPEGALFLAQRGLDILNGTLGKNNPKTLRCLNGIAAIQFKLGNKKQAERILRDVLETATALMGANHESLAAYMSNLGSVLAAQGRHSEASSLFARAIALEEQKRDNAFLILSEQQKLNFTAGMLLQVQLYLSHLAQHGPFNEQAVVTAMNNWLRWKGAVMEAQGRYVEALYHSGSPLLQQRFDELVQVKRELAAIQIFSDKGNGARLRAGAADGLEKKKQTLEAELSRLSSQYALDRSGGKVDVARLAGLLPPDAVYIDFAVTEGVNHSLQLSEKPRYAAFVLVPGDSTPVKLVDIADREALDGLVQGYLHEMARKAAARADHDPQRLARYSAQIFDTVMKPLMPLLKGRRNLFISPDGALNLIPFEVLTDSSARYLAEGFQINYAASGRDILRYSVPAVVKAGPSAIFADPDFDMEIPVSGKGGALPAGAGGFGSIRFERLADTKQEADAIVRLLAGAREDVVSYQGRKADQQSLFAVSNPRILHLATHGYFLKGDMKGSANTRGLKVVLKSDLIEEPGELIENPMLRSGIVLAGANSALKRGVDVGVISAEKMLGLRLAGTELVTLSACETAMGDVMAGEGVFGLKRAFLLSGAKTLVISLWSVPSAETVELMTDFYRLMQQGISRGQALRQAKLNMMKKKKHPFYWGAFVMIGKPD